jgi:hypothetical protein
MADDYLTQYYSWIIPSTNLKEVIAGDVQGVQSAFQADAKAWRVRFSSPAPYNISSNSGHKKML